MISITNGERTFRVTKGAFTDIFNRYGFSVFNEKSPVVHVTVDEEEYETDIVDPIIEKPIAQWTNKEVTQFAEEHHIDLSEAKNIAEKRILIRDAIEGLSFEDE